MLAVLAVAHAFGDGDALEGRPERAGAEPEGIARALRALPEEPQLQLRSLSLRLFGRKSLSFSAAPVHELRLFRSLIQRGRD
jgi:hypothetical protein